MLEKCFTQDVRHILQKAFFRHTLEHNCSETYYVKKFRFCICNNIHADVMLLRTE